MRKNEKGSSLIFALAVISIITMVIAACMAISYSYYNRSIVANSERQAYLTAKSVLTNIVDNITAKDTEYLNLIPDVGESETYSVDDNFPSSEMGDVDSITMNRYFEEKDEAGKVKDNLTISVTVTYGKSNKTINADIKQYKDENNNWQLSEYYEGEKEKFKNTDINVERAKKLLNYDEIFMKTWDKVTDNKHSTFQKLLQYNEDGTETELYKMCKTHTECKFGSLQPNDTRMRNVIFYGYYDGSYDEFDSSIVRKDISEKASQYITSNKFYIVDKFPHQGNTPSIVYGYKDNIVRAGSWSTLDKIVYCPEDQAWYYVDKGFKVKDFDADTADETQQKWNDFVTNTLHNKDEAEKIT